MQCVSNGSKEIGTESSVSVEDSGRKNQTLGDFWQRTRLGLGMKLVEKND